MVKTKTKDLSKVIQLWERKERVICLKEELIPNIIGFNSKNSDDSTKSILTELNDALECWYPVGLTNCNIIHNLNYSFIDLNEIDTIEKLKKDFNDSLLQLINEKGNNEVNKDQYRTSYYLLKINDDNISLDEIMDWIKLKWLCNLVLQDYENKDKELLTSISSLENIDLTDIQGNLNLDDEFIFLINTFLNY